MSPWSDKNHQKNTHSLLGSNADPAKNIRMARAKVMSADSEADLSVALHYFGDAFAHQRMSGDGYYGDKGVVTSLAGKAFELIMGGTAEHAEGHEPDGSKTGLRPDLIYERPQLYKQYVSELAAVLSDKYGASGQLEMSVFDRMISYAVDNQVSLLGIINYEVAAVSGNSSFILQNSQGAAPFNIFEYSNNVEAYLTDQGVTYEKIYNYTPSSESWGGVRFIQSIEFKIISNEDQSIDNDN